MVHRVPDLKGILPNQNSCLDLDLKPHHPHPHYSTQASQESLHKPLLVLKMDQCGVSLVVKIQSHSSTFSEVLSVSVDTKFKPMKKPITGCVKLCQVLAVVHVAACHSELGLGMGSE